MVNVRIKKIKEDLAAGGHSFFEELEGLFEQIRGRAYSIFQQRGGGEGSDLDDWLRAEREFLWTPPADLIDTGEDLRVQIAVPGFEAHEIEVTALPGTIIVRAESKQEQGQQVGEVLISELSSRKLYRRFDLCSYRSGEDNSQAGERCAPDRRAESRAGPGEDDFRYFRRVSPGAGGPVHLG